jgi:hypothetical protein
MFQVEGSLTRVLSLGSCLCPSKASLLAAGMSETGVEGGPQFLADQLTYLNQGGRLCPPYYYPSPFPRKLLVPIKSKCPSSRDVWNRGARGPPVFGRSVNPILTRGVDYAHHITTAPPPDFQTVRHPWAELEATHLNQNSCMEALGTVHCE